MTLENATKENATWTDEKGMTWTMSLDPFLTRSIKDKTGLLLTDLESTTFEKLATDSLLLCDVLWLLCEDQAKAESIDEREFAKRIAPKIDEATVALEAAVINFCHASRRSLLKEFRSKSKTTMAKAMTKAMETLETNQPRIDEAMTRMLTKDLEKLLESFDSVDSGASKSATS